MKTSALIVRSWKGQAIQRRRADGFVNATAMCSANGKLWSKYRESSRCQDYLKALAKTSDIRMFDLIQSIPGRHGGTWVHPLLAVDLARWISPESAVWMDGWLLEELEAKAKPPQVAYLFSGEEVGQIMNMLCEDVKATADRFGAMVAFPNAQRCGGSLAIADECLERLKGRIDMLERLMPAIRPAKPKA
jgi:hypothetical protein